MTTRIRRLTIVATILALTVTALPAFAASGTVNINSASAEQLELLPRVGPALAGRIIDYRDANGGFAETQELMLVKGIGEKTFARMEPYVAVSGETTLTESVRAQQAPSSD